MYDAFIKWFVPFLCGGVITLCGMLVSQLKKSKKRQDAIELGLQSLLRAEIIRQHEKWEEKHYCPIYAKEALKRTYDSYHLLGGNDVATGLYNKTMGLPEELHENNYGRSYL